MLNVPPALTTPGKLQCLPQDLPRAATKKRKCQLLTLPTASGKLVKKSLLNPKILALKIELEQKSILLNIFIRPLESPIFTTSSS